MSKLDKVVVLYEQITQNGQWKRPFNQVTFFNRDPVNPVTVNLFSIGPNQQHQVNLNTYQINDSFYNIDLQNSTTSQLWVVYTEYREVLSNGHNIN